MVFDKKIKSEYVVVDTSAFIRNANLQEIGEKIITIPEVVDEIKSKRQLRRLVVLPYDLQIKEAFPESISYVAEFAKKTGDFRSLSATDIKVMAMTYQLEKEHVGTDHLKTLPQINRSVDYCNYSAITAENVAGFYKPKKDRKSNNSESADLSDVDETKDDKSMLKSLENCSIYEDESDYESACSDLSDLDKFVETEDNNADNFKSTDKDNDDDNELISENANFKTIDESDDLINSVFVKVNCDESSFQEMHSESNKEEESERINEGNCNETECDSEEDYDDDDSGWITPSNVKQMKQEMDAGNLEEKPVKVACLTMDFAMQNVLKQMGLNIISLDGRVIKQMRTFILRCYACFKTTSVMTRVFCHHCGNKTLKKVAVSLDSEGNQKIHINLRRPLTARGKKFSLPKPTGGKHSNYPLLSEDQPVPDQRPSRLARMKNNPLEPDYIAGFSPFVMRDVNSKSAMLGVPNQAKEMKHWMRRNPNESFGKKKKKK